MDDSCLKSQEDLYDQDSKIPFDFFDMKIPSKIEFLLTPLTINPL